VHYYQCSAGCWTLNGSGGRSEDGEGKRFAGTVLGSGSASTYAHYRTLIGSHTLSACYWLDRTCPSATFHPHDAMLARVLAILPCVRLCLSQVAVLSKQLNEPSWFWHESFLRPVLHHSGTFQNKGTSSGTLLQTLDVENFATAYRSPKRVINLARESRKLGV